VLQISSTHHHLNPYRLGEWQRYYRLLAKEFEGDMELLFELFCEVLRTWPRHSSFNEAQEWYIWQYHNLPKKGETTEHIEDRLGINLGGKR